MQPKVYIGTKVVKATPCTQGQFFMEKEDHKLAITTEQMNTPGYRVEYEDGYKSWSPKDTFERCYREVTKYELALLAPEPITWPKRGEPLRKAMNFPEQQQLKKEYMNEPSFEPILENPSTNPPKRLTKEGFEFIGDDSKEYLCRMWESTPWFFYKHVDGQWVSLRQVTQIEIWEAYKRRIPKLKTCSRCGTPIATSDNICPTCNF